MTHTVVSKENYLGPVAWAALAVGAIAVGLVLVRLVIFSGESAIAQAALHHKFTAQDKNDAVLVAQAPTERGTIMLRHEVKKTIRVDHAAPLALLGAAPQPRLKPKRRYKDVAIATPVEPAALSLTASGAVGFADADDFTGGRDALFDTYSEVRGRNRAELSYKTAVLNRGVSLAETLIAVGAREDEVKALLGALKTDVDIATLKPGTAIEYAFETIFVAAQAPSAGVEDAAQMAASTAAPTASTSMGQFVTKQRVLSRLRFRPADRDVLTAWRQPDATYTARLETLDVEMRYAAVAGVIRHSLFAAAAKTDIPPEIMSRFANLFLYDVDFARDIQSGDRFEAVYQVFYDTDGHYVGSGDIVFAGMSWRGNRYSRSYYRYDEAKGSQSPYFDAKGESSTRLLMKTPIEGARVTSSFGRRKHPILGYSKSHKGVDFGAPRGTPIMAAGDGVIERAAPTGSFGKYVKIKHAHGYQTAYAHMDRFARGIVRGSKVRQGQIIGYVGSTGRSTGPHLHYEVHKGTKVQNPMTIKVANGRSLTDEDLKIFLASRRQVDGIRLHPLTVAAR